MYVGNHPNGLVDPGIVFVLSRRQVTFLAKEPLFRLPLLGAVLRGLGALPVFRKQDGDGDTSKNEGTLSAATNALVAGHAITIFPEGKSHSEPQLSALKTGAARIVLAAAEQGAPVHLVPVGITYEAKHLFHSAVHVEVDEAWDRKEACPIEANRHRESCGHRLCRRPAQKPQSCSLAQRGVMHQCMCRLQARCACTCPATGWCVPTLRLRPHFPQPSLSLSISDLLPAGEMWPV